MFKRNKQGGFTLIELLVVIAIIAILSTVVMAGLNSARQKGRDAKRISDIKSLQSALELFSDTCQGYPPNTAGDILNGTTNTAAGLDGGEITGGAACGGCITMNTYMTSLPLNSGPGGKTYMYCGATLGAGSPPVVPLTGGICGAATATSYLVGFNLEGVSGSLKAGDVHATPGGLKGQP